MNEIYISPKIQIRKSKLLGKGYFARQDIMKGDTIMKVSEQSLISCQTFSHFYEFDQIKREEKQIDLKSILAFFLAAIKVMGVQQHSQLKFIWQYFEYLPQRLHGLICWTDYQLSLIRNIALVKHIKEKKRSIEEQFQKIYKFVQNLDGKPKKVGQYRIFNKIRDIQKISYSHFLYFYSVIESRSVYFTCNQDTKSNAGALAPFLELFNHSIDNQCDVISYTVSATRFIGRNEQIFVRYCSNKEEQHFLENYGFLESLEKVIEENEEYRERLAQQYNKMYEKKGKQVNDVKL